MKRYTHVKILLAAGLLCLALGGCATPRETLYDALGRSAGIDQITRALIVQIGNAPDIRPFFEETDLERFQSKLNEQLCQVSGGPCDYTGDPMDKVHAGMDITEANFNRVVELLIDAMDESGIPHPVQNQLLARLAPLRAEML